MDAVAQGSTPATRDLRYPQGVAMILTGGVCLSLSGILIRQIESASGWQILFWRSLALTLTVLAFIALRHRGRIVRPVRAIGLTGVVVALLLTVAFVGFVFALLLTTVANVVFTLGATPFVAALLGWWLLGETLRRATAIAIIAAIAGIGVMVADGLAAGRALGNLVAMLTVFGFAFQIILLRRARGIDMVPAAGLAGIFTAALAAVMADGLAIGAHDLLVCVLLGTVNVGFGAILLTSGARFVPAAEVALLSLAEAVLAPIWVALLIGEVPSSLTLAGGGLVLAAVTGQALGALRWQRARHPGLGGETAGTDAPPARWQEPGGRMMAQQHQKPDDHAKPRRDEDRRPTDERERSKHEAEKDIVDVTSEDSFPASDPPSWTSIRHPGAESER